MYCKSCGAKLPENAEFCHICGDASLTQGVPTSSAFQMAANNQSVKAEKQLKKLWNISAIFLLTITAIFIINLIYTAVSGYFAFNSIMNTSKDRSFANQYLSTMLFSYIFLVSIPVVFDVLSCIFWRIGVNKNSIGWCIGYSVFSLISIIVIGGSLISILVLRWIVFAVFEAFNIIILIIKVKNNRKLKIDQR